MGWSWADPMSLDLLAAAWVRRKFWEAHMQAELTAIALGRIPAGGPRQTARRVAPAEMLDLLGMHNGG